jgi:hypothetical protein
LVIELAFRAKEAFALSEGFLFAIKLQKNLSGMQSSVLCYFLSLFGNNEEPAPAEIFKIVKKSHCIGVAVACMI